jgi:hypothetical protein
MIVESISVIEAQRQRPEPGVTSVFDAEADMAKSAGMTESQKERPLSP